MGKERELTIKILGNSASAEASLKRLQADLDRTGSRLGDLGDKVSDAGQRMTKFATLPIAAGLALSIKAASDLGETVSKSNTIFGTAGAEMEKWASTTASAMGQSKKQALDAAATFGNLFVQLGVGAAQAGAMSKEMVQLASDFASFQNADVTQVLEAQTAAFRGEYDALQKFVPTINAATVEQRALEMTGKAATKELTAQEKALAVQKLMMEGAGAAVGDFARTSDGLANQTRILKAQLADTTAELGAKLLPVALKAVDVASNLAGQFSKLSPEVQTAALGFVGLVAAVGPVTTAAGSAMKAINLFRNEAGGIKPTAIGAAGGLAVFALATAAFVKSGADATTQAREFVEAINADVDTSSYESLRKKFNEVNTAAYATGKAFTEQNAGLGGLKRGVIEFAQRITPLADDQVNLRKKTDELTDANTKQRAQLLLVSGALDSFAMATGLSRKEVEKLAEKNKVDLTGSYGDITNALFSAKAGTTAQTGASKDLADAQSVLSDKTSSAEDNLKAFKTSLDNALGGTLSITEASIRHQDAIDRLREKIDENGKSLDINNPKSRETASAFNAVVQSAEAEVEALVKSGQVTEGSAEQKRALTQRLEDLKRKFPELRGPIDGYIGRIDAIPDTKNTTTGLLTGGAEAQADAYKGKLRGIPGSTETTVGLITGGAEAQALKFADFLRANIPRNAFSTPGFDPQDFVNQYFYREQGGPVTKGQAYVVGEKRPELFVPTESGYILPQVPSGFPYGGQQAGGTSKTYQLSLNGTFGEVIDVQEQFHRMELLSG